VPALPDRLHQKQKRGVGFCAGFFHCHIKIVFININVADGIGAGRTFGKIGKINRFSVCGFFQSPDKFESQVSLPAVSRQSEIKVCNSTSWRRPLKSQLTEAVIFLAKKSELTLSFFGQKSLFSCWWN